jgi:hypothetical protein
MAGKTSKMSAKVAKKAAKPTLLAGGNPARLGSVAPAVTLVPKYATSRLRAIRVIPPVWPGRARDPGIRDRGQRPELPNLAVGLRGVASGFRHSGSVGGHCCTSTRFALRSARLRRGRAAMSPHRLGLGRA